MPAASVGLSSSLSAPSVPGPSPWSVAPAPVPAAPVALSAVHAAPAAGEHAPSRPTSAAVFDLDGNVFGYGFPTKIILFRKGSDEELPVSTAHFAVIERYIGRDYAYGGANLVDYELRGDESFREFMGPKFAADLQYAVENMPPSEWQGPSWEALVRALSDPRDASLVYVLTARQHASEQLLEGFRYLQRAGYIRFLPKVGQLHGVGGSRDTARRKAELMAGFIDAIQASPVGADGGRHAIGFSDDTWANYETMREALSAILRREPGRWSRVKIVLFFTGRNDIAHRPEAVIFDADGAVRPYVSGERR